MIKDYDRIRLNMVVFNFSLVVDRGSVFWWKLYLNGLIYLFYIYYLLFIIIKILF
jgi:hypothetical protein